MVTMFGLVLAIGIVVDDAIVVVEAVQHKIDQGMSPRDATIQAMHEVSGPVVAIALVLSAVFVPVAFLGGISGEIYRQLRGAIVAISGVALHLGAGDDNGYALSGGSTIYGEDGDDQARAG
jgi:multidrug efflux pump subunit AcrB